MNLDYDVLYITLNEMNLTEFINMASTNSRIASVAADAFHLNYRDFKISISDFSYRVQPGDEIWDGRNISISMPPRKRIQIADYQLGLSALQCFRRDIKEVYIHEKYTTDILEKLTEPLDSVEELSIDIKQNGSNILPISQLFPRLRRLSVHLKRNVDISFVNCELPQLEHLSIHAEYDAWNQQNHIEGMIQKNAQIKSFEFGGFPAKYIKVIKQLLPNLTNLTLHHQKIETEDDIVRFEHLKRLELKGNEPMILLSLRTYKL